jgi:hypothetical protein
MFDEEKALDEMVRVTQRNDERNVLTLYAVVCPEHGGLVCRNAAEAIEGARESNDGIGACSYIAVALTLVPARMPEFPGEDA